MRPFADLVEELREPFSRALGADVVPQALAVARAKLVLRGCVTGERVRAYGPVRVRGTGRVVIGGRCFFLHGMIRSELVSHPAGELRIGEGTGLNYGVSIEAHQRIEIGSRCMLASMVRITDRGPAGTLPVVVEDDVWIAHGAILEPGSRIGRGSVVSAGSVVTGEIPPDSLAIGNPARPMKLDLFRGRGAPATR